MTKEEKNERETLNWQKKTTECPQSSGCQDLKTKPKKKGPSHSSLREKRTPFTVVSLSWDLTKPLKILVPTVEFWKPPTGTNSSNGNKKKKELFPLFLRFFSLFPTLKRMCLNSVLPLAKLCKYANYRRRKGMIREKMKKRVQKEEKKRSTAM